MPRTLALSVLALALHLGAAEPPLVRLEMKDGVLTPLRVQVPAGQAFKLEVRNTGKTPAEFESKPLRQEKVVPPGGTVTFTFKALAAGEYRFVDEFHEQMATARGVLEAR